MSTAGAENNKQAFPTTLLLIMSAENHPLPVNSLLIRSSGKNSNKYCRHFTLKEGKNNSLPLKCGMHIVTSFQRVQDGKGGERTVIFQWRNLINTSSTGS